MLGPLSFTNSIGKSQGDHAEAVNTLTAGVIAMFHKKKGNLVRRKKMQGGKTLVHFQ